MAWGRNLEYECNVPALPSGLAYVEVAAGWFHTVARRSDGSVVAWGEISSGQCNVPALPNGLAYVEVAAGWLHTVARRSDGSVVAWGYNSSGQCSVPALPSGLAYVEVAAGTFHTVARRSDGSVAAWGYNGQGECNVPALPSGLSYVEVAAGGGFTVARRSDGSVLAWGRNLVGQCNVPVLPTGYAYVALAAGDAHTVARVETLAEFSYCTAGTTTNGCVPSIASAGTPSASAGSGFTISVDDVEGTQWGRIFYGLSGAAALPWGAGTSFLCVTPPLERGPNQNSGGTYGACDGVLSLDWNLYIASKPLALGNPFAGGQVVCAQAWFRDPPSPKTANLSDALQFTVHP